MDISLEPKSKLRRFAPYIAAIALFIGACIWLCTVPLQVRRLHDTGRGPTLAYINAGLYILTLILSFVSVIMLQNLSLDNLGTIGTLTTFMGLVALVYFVITIILIVFWCQDSQPGTNQYGPSPKYPDFQ